MNILEKFFLYLFPQYEDLHFKECHLKYLTKVNDYNQKHIKHLNDEIKSREDKILVLDIKLEKIKKDDEDWISKKMPVIKTEPIIKIRSQEGWHFIDELPKFSIPECIVTDGEIVAMAQWDHNTKQFLKCFGAQSMYIDAVIAWMPLPLPPKDHKGKLQNRNNSFSFHHAQTYIR